MNRKINYIIGIVIVILAIAYFSLDTKLKNNAQHSIATVVGGSQYIY